MANDFESVLATCKRFQDIATWDPEHFNANGALARISELHRRTLAKIAELNKRELAAVCAERDEWQKQALEENAALDVARAELTAKDEEIAKRNALIKELAEALNAYLLEECFSCDQLCKVNNLCDHQVRFRALIAKAREVTK